MQAHPLKMMKKSCTLSIDDGERIEHTNSTKEKNQTLTEKKTSTEVCGLFDVIRVQSIAH